jgi:hypothetical protein
MTFFRGLTPTSVSKKSRRTLQCGVPCFNHSVSPFVSTTLPRIRHANMKARQTMEDVQVSQTPRAIRQIRSSPALVCDRVKVQLCMVIGWVRLRLRVRARVMVRVRPKICLSLSLFFQPLLTSSPRERGEELNKVWQKRDRERQRETEQ